MIMNDDRQCPVCGITKTGNTFLTSFDRLKHREIGSLTPEATYTRICQYAKKEGCINTCKIIDENETFENRMMIKYE